MSGVIASTKREIEKLEFEVKHATSGEKARKEIYKLKGEAALEKTLEYIHEKEEELNNLSLWLYQLYDQFPLLGLQMRYEHHDEELWQIISSINKQVEEDKQAQKEYERQLAHFEELKEKYPAMPSPQEPVRRKKGAVPDIHEIVRDALEKASSYAFDSISGKYEQEKEKFPGLCGIFHADVKERQENVDLWLKELLPFDTLRLETLTRIRDPELTTLALEELDKIRKQEKDMVGISIPLYVAGMGTACGLGWFTGGISCGAAITIFGAGVSGYELSDHYARHVDFKRQILSILMQ